MSLVLLGSSAVPEDIYYYLVMVVHRLGPVNYIFWVPDMLVICFLWYVFDFFASSFPLMIAYLDLSNVSVFRTFYQLQNDLGCCVCPEKKTMVDFVCYGWVCYT